MSSEIHAGRSTTTKAAAAWTWRWVPASQLFGQFFQQNAPSVQPGLFPLSGLLYENESTLAMMQHSWSLSPSAS